MGIVYKLLILCLVKVKLLVFLFTLSFYISKPVTPVILYEFNSIVAFQIRIIYIYVITFIILIFFRYII